MFISRRLAHKAQNELTVILGFIELGRTEDAKKRIQDLSKLLSSHTETAEHEAQRQRQEDADSFHR